MFKLNYKILGRRRLEGDTFGIELVDIAWTHADGPFVDFVRLPVSHPAIHPLMKQELERYELFESGRREVVKDTISVKPGTPDSVVMQILEEKREGLARTLNVEP